MRVIKLIHANTYIRTQIGNYDGAAPYDTSITKETRISHRVRSLAPSHAPFSIGLASPFHDFQSARQRTDESRWKSISKIWMRHGGVGSSMVE